MNKTWDRKAMRIASAEYVPRQGMLGVTFENGDRFLLATEVVLPAARGFQGNGARGASPTAHAWMKVRIGPTRDVLEIPTRSSVIEIPWDRIRSLADPEFRAHLADRAQERVRRLGARIRTLRLEAGLTRPALAKKLDVTRATIAKWETGQTTPGLEMIERVASALRRRLRDFTE